VRPLSIRQPHVEAILRGAKKIEYRSLAIKIRGEILFYASLGRYDSAEEAEMMKRYGIKDVAVDDLPRGVLVGTVTIVDCTGEPGDYHWHLRDPKRASRLRKSKNHPQPVWFNPF
jgi:hypothetical protein